MPSFAGIRVSVAPVESVTVALYSSNTMPAKGKRRERTVHWTRMRLSLEVAQHLPALGPTISYRRFFRMRLQRRRAAARRLSRNAASLHEALHPNHHHAGAQSIAFGRLTP